MKIWILVLFCAAAITYSSGMDFENSDIDFYVFKSFDGPLYDSDFHEPYETYGNSYSSEDNSDNSSSDENNEDNEDSKNAMVNEGDATKVIENNDDTSGSHEDNDEDNDSAETTVQKQKPVKKLKTVDPDQKKLKETGDYISPEDVEYRLTRQKRSKKPKSEEIDDDDEEFDGYTQTYRDFVREHFTTDEQDEDENENNSSEEAAATQAAKVNKNNNNQSDEENNNEDNDENVDESDEAEDDVDYQHVKKLTEREAEESKRTPQYCKIIYKDDQECTVCKNPKTHDTSESCSYSSSPAPKRYAFKRQKNYNSKDNDDNDHNNENDDKKDKHAKTLPADDSDEDNEPKQRKKNSSSKKSKKNIKSKKSTEEHNPVEEKLRTYENPHYYGNYYNNDRYTNSPLRSQTLPEYDDDLSFRASEPYVASTSSDGNVDKVLESFKNRDWSKCKHKREKGITCYYCKDKDGTTQEECMYSSDMDEDKPVSKKTHLDSMPDFSIENKSTSTQIPFSLKDEESVYKNPFSIIATFNNNQRKLNRDQNFKINPNINNNGVNNENYHDIQSSNNQQHQNRRSFNVGGPITTLEYIEPKNKITLKRMISSTYKVHEDSEQTDPTENKSLFYSKLINNNNGFKI